jgi:predicted DNA-binding transcriptional regulator YafY
VTAQRSARFYKLLFLLRGGSRTREELSRRLRIDVRGFYRDLKSLRELGVRIVSHGDGYELRQSFDASVARLPFPDPQLNLSEAMQLADGKSAAHRKLQAQIRRIAGPAVK